MAAEGSSTATRQHLPGPPCSLTSSSARAAAPASWGAVTPRSHRFGAWYLPAKDWHFQGAAVSTWERTASHLEQIAAAHRMELLVQSSAAQRLDVLGNHQRALETGGHFGSLALQPVSGSGAAGAPGTAAAATHRRFMSIPSPTDAWTGRRRGGPPSPHHTVDYAGGLVTGGAAAAPPPPAASALSPAVLAAVAEAEGGNGGSSSSSSAAAGGAPLPAHSMFLSTGGGSSSPSRADSVMISNHVIQLEREQRRVERAQARLAKQLGGSYGLKAYKRACRGSGIWLVVIQMHVLRELPMTAKCKPTQPHLLQYFDSHTTAPTEYMQHQGYRQAASLQLLPTPTDKDIKAREERERRRQDALDARAAATHRNAAAAAGGVGGTSAFNTSPAAGALQQDPIGSRSTRSTESFNSRNGGVEHAEVANTATGDAAAKGTATNSSSTGLLASASAKQPLPAAARKDWERPAIVPRLALGALVAITAGHSLSEAGGLLGSSSSSSYGAAAIGTAGSAREQMPLESADRQTLDALLSDRLSSSSSGRDRGRSAESQPGDRGLKGSLSALASVMVVGSSSSDGGARGVGSGSGRRHAALALSLGSTKGATSTSGRGGGGASGSSLSTNSTWGVSRLATSSGGGQTVVIATPNSSSGGGITASNMEAPFSSLTGGWHIKPQQHGAAAMGVEGAPGLRQEHAPPLGPLHAALQLLTPAETSDSAALHRLVDNLESRGGGGGGDDVQRASAVSIKAVAGAHAVRGRSTSPPRLLVAGQTSGGRCSSGPAGELTSRERMDDGYTGAVSYSLTPRQ